MSIFGTLGTKQNHSEIQNAGDLCSLSLPRSLVTVFLTYLNLKDGVCAEQEKLPQNSSLRDLDRFQFIMSPDARTDADDGHKGGPVDLQPKKLPASDLSETIRIRGLSCMMSGQKRSLIKICVFEVFWKSHAV